MDMTGKYVDGFVVPVPRKNIEAYKAFAAWAQTQRGVHIKRLRSDRGGEYTSNKFTAFLREQGTERRLTTADTPKLSTTQCG